MTMDWLAALAIVIGLPGLAAAAHLGTLALASLMYRAPRSGSAKQVRFLVLVPAHDEAAVIDGCLASGALTNARRTRSSW